MITYLCSAIFLERNGFHMRAFTSIKKTWNPLSSAAMSLRRIQIDYTVNGRHEIMLISPVKRDEFLREVEKRMGIQNIKKESL